MQPTIGENLNVSDAPEGANLLELLQLGPRARAFVKASRELTWLCAPTPCKGKSQNSFQCAKCRRKETGLSCIIDPRLVVLCREYKGPRITIAARLHELRQRHLISKTNRNLSSDAKIGATAKTSADVLVNWKCPVKGCTYISTDEKGSCLRAKRKTHLLLHGVAGQEVIDALNKQSHVTRAAGLRSCQDAIDAAWDVKLNACVDQLNVEKPSWAHHFERFKEEPRVSGSSRWRCTLCKAKSTLGGGGGVLQSFRAAVCPKAPQAAKDMKLGFGVRSSKVAGLWKSIRKESNDAKTSHMTERKRNHARAVAAHCRS